MARNGITPTYISFVQSCNRALIGHLYEFTALDGAVDYFTDLDWPVVYSGVTWKASSLRVEGLRRKTSVGLEVDEQEIKIYAGPLDTLFGASFLQAAEVGVLDGCLLTRFRIVWGLITGNFLHDIQTYSPVQVFTMFKGYISEITKGGQTRIEMKVKSPLVKLEVNMPRNYYQPGCLWTLFDTGCTLNKASFAVNGSVAANGANSLIQFAVSGGVSPTTGADNIPYFAQGRILFTSGINNGILSLVNTNDSTFVYMAYPLVGVPAVGDTFTYYPGCSKSFSTCQAKFANSANFRGFDKVPPIAVSI